MLALRELRITRRAAELNENRPPDGGRRFRVVAGARNRHIYDLHRTSIHLKLALF